MHTTYHLGISFPHDIILSLLLILAFLNSVSALVTLRVSLRGCFEARVAGKRTTVKKVKAPKPYNKQPRVITVVLIKPR